MAGPYGVVVCGDARSLPLADGSVQCVVTSPPYWGLRDYGVDGQIGLEPTPERYVAHMVEVFREVRRVLRGDGTCWVNLGDSYANGGIGRRDTTGDYAERRAAEYGSGRGNGNGPREYVQRETPPGLKPKDLVGIPWRVAFALQADGWWLRSDVIWSKPNPMPESITDRPTKAHEYVFLLTKSARYFYDAEAIKEPSTDPESHNGYHRSVATSALSHADDQGYDGHRTRIGILRAKTSGVTYPTRNRRSVWTIATEPYPEAHFATFPEKLVEPCILAGTSERGACPTCGAPWGRVVERTISGRDAHGIPLGDTSHDGIGRHRAARRAGESAGETLGWTPSCQCDDRVLHGDIDPPIPVVPCKVLDPFAGSGTTVAVAERLGRVGIGVELKPDYIRLARQRTVQAGLL